MKFSVSFVAAIATLGGLAQAAVINTARAAQDVFVPHITQPSANDIWKVGQTVTATWDTTHAPEKITNPNGYIMLRKGDLTTPLILARDFHISDGTVAFVVPDLVPDNDYQIVLFGDSGNFSPLFSIESDAFTPQPVIQAASA